MPKPNNIDEYLATVSSDRRAALQKLREDIHSIVPDAEECISYSMPAFRVDGHVVAGFLATKQGCSYFPFSGTTLATLGAELAGFGRTKSALHFDTAKRLPLALVRRLLKARLAEFAPSKHSTPKKSPTKKAPRAMSDVDASGAKKAPTKKSPTKKSPRAMSDVGASGAKKAPTKKPLPKKSASKKARRTSNTTGRRVH